MRGLLGGEDAAERFQRESGTRVRISWASSFTPVPDTGLLPQQFLGLAPQEPKREPPVPGDRRPVRRRLVDGLDRLVERLASFRDIAEAVLSHGLKQPAINDAARRVFGFVENGLRFVQSLRGVFEPASAEERRRRGLGGCRRSPGRRRIPLQLASESSDNRCRRQGPACTSTSAGDWGRARRSCRSDRASGRRSSGSSLSDRGTGTKRIFIAVL